MDEGLKDLDDPAKCSSNPDGGLILIRDHLEEWFRFELLKKMIA